MQEAGEQASLHLLIFSISYIAINYIVSLFTT